MQGLLANLKKKQQQQQRSMSIRPESTLNSRSASIASSMNDDDEQQNDEPKVDSNKKKKGGYNSTKEIKPPPKKSRIDSNIVKLKLLDATRKAIMDKTLKPQSTRNSVETQTDTIKTKLCKDVEVDNQADLVSPVDQSTETEIDYIATKSADGKLIVTQTSAVNTDEISKDTVSTQTVMPRSSVSFKKAYDPRHKIQYFDDDEEEEEAFSEPDLELMNLEKKFTSSKGNKLTRQASQNKQRIDIVIEDESSDVIAIETIPTEPRSPRRAGRSRRRSRSRRDSDSDYDEVYEEPKVIEPRRRDSKVDEAGYNWHDLDFPERKVELPRNYFTEGPTPWSNFQDLILGRRFLESKFSPMPSIPQRPQPMYQSFQQQTNARHVTWSEPQVRIINDLMREANGLLDMFDQVAMLLGPDIKLHNVSDVEEFELPPSKYNDEMTKACEKLEANLKKLDDIEESRKQREMELKANEKK